MATLHTRRKTHKSKPPCLVSFPNTQFMLVFTRIKRSAVLQN